MNLKSIIYILSALTLSGCSTLTLVNEGGAFWCNEPYLNKSDISDNDVQNDKKLKFAHDGYVYSLAAALTLQSSDDKKEEDHFFPTPDYLKQIEPFPYYKGSMGFEARTYIYSPLNKPKEIIIAIAGSQDKGIFNDWIATNFLRVDNQHNEAKNYIYLIEKFKTENNYQDIKTVITGFSLGGGLASYVAITPETSSFIDEVWLFNPSPVIYPEFFSKQKIPANDPRFYLASTYNEFAGKLPGKNKYPIIIPSNQRFTNFRQVKANPIYNHFRWVLTRTMLVYADLYEKDKNIISNRPRELIEDSYFTSCKLQEIDTIKKPFSINQSRYK